MTLAHLKIESSRVSPWVLLPGDPARVDLIGKKLGDFKILGQNREFRIGVGTYCGVPATVCSTGIGSPSTAIAVEELISAGARTLIRVGTCGGAWRSDIRAGSLIVPTASVRDEGTSREYVPDGFPAVADPSVVLTIERSARAIGKPVFVGLNRTHDAFYGNEDAITKWKDAPIISSDMETSALFVVASLRGARAGAILAANADPEPPSAWLTGDIKGVATELNETVTAEIVDAAIVAALETLVILSNHHLDQPS